ncbi:MAG: c-type cytochrome [Sphingorhabdus sp.]
MRSGYIIIALSLALAACGGGGEPDAVSPDTTTATPPVATAALSGEKIFAKCSACHKIEKGAANGVGPNLHGIVGKAVASVEGYNYSAALKAKGGVWDAAALDAYLENPRKFAPGTKMAFAGINNAEERKVLIDWMAAQK